MSILKSISVDEVRCRGSIKDSDVVKLQAAFRDGQTIIAEEAEHLIALDAACPVKDPAWYPFLVEAITDYIVLQAKPEGYMVRDKTDWLIGHLEQHGQIAASVGIEMLATVIERARWSPPTLAVYGLGLVKTAVATGRGPLRSGIGLEAGAISQGEINLLMRLLVAFGGDSGIPVTRAEADVMIDINRALAPGKSSPAWTELFVKTVGNAALSGLGMVVPDRQTALGAEAWLIEVTPAAAATDRVPHLVRAGASAASRARGGYAGRMIAGGAGSVWSACRRQTAEERALARLERQRWEIITNEAIAEPDEAWLLASLGQSGKLDDNEMALLAFLGREAAQLPPALVKLAAGATIAA